MCVFAVPLFLYHLEGKGGSGAYPHWFYATAWGICIVGAIWWTIKGIQGLLLFASPFEEEKVKWEEQFAQDEGKYRGGSRRTVIILGIAAITVWLIVSLFLRSYH
jgi:hypothetical protein